jgi:hypothetical protein
MLLSSIGTSMATPCVAGNAALVRQYFEDSRFWESSCNVDYGCKAFSPKGATVKAMLISSGEAMRKYMTYVDYSDTKEPTSALSATPDMYQGFGRISLQNVLPYIGITSALDLYVDEAEIMSLEKVTYYLNVTDVSIPVKVTMVWMDPANSVLSAKMLLHDLDIIVTAPDGTKYYGNNIPGDENNNVEQVSILSPRSGIYVIDIQANIFSESVSQFVSIVVTSGGGTVYDKIVLSTDSDAENPLNCSSTEFLLSLTKMDRGGDGWGAGNAYVIRNVDNSIFKIGGMNGAVRNDSLAIDKFCIPLGIYTVSLQQNGQSASDMALDIPQCMEYLSSYDTSSTLNIISSTECNTCTGNALTITLVGSSYGIPYGWKDGSKYTLEKTSDTDFQTATGTLATGILADRVFCLLDGSYDLSFLGVPSSDDFLDDASYIADYAGVEEYGILINNCEDVTDYTDDSGDDGAYVMIPPGSVASIVVSGSSCSFSITSGDDASKANKDYKLSPAEISGIVVTAIFFIFAVGGGLFYFYGYRGAARRQAKRETAMEVVKSPINANNA